MIKRLAVHSGIALTALTIVLSPTAAVAAVHAGAGTLVPVKFGLGYAKEGVFYSTSIAGAATGGVKPYHCAPAESFGPLWAWLHVSAGCVIGGKVPNLPAGTTERTTVLTFKLTDSESPPKTVTLYPMVFSIHSNSVEYPFDGTWKLNTTVTLTISCPHVPTITRSATGAADLTIARGVAAGHALSVSPSGTSATVTTRLTVAGLTTVSHDEFTVAGAVSSVHGTGTESGSLGGCPVKGHATTSGSRISP